MLGGVFRLVDNVLQEDITLGVDVGRNKVIFKASCAKDSGGRNGDWTAVKVAVVGEWVESR